MIRRWQPHAVVQRVHDQRRDGSGGGDAVYRSGDGLVGAELKVTGNEKGLTTAFGGNASTYLVSILNTVRFAQRADSLRTLMNHDVWTVCAKQLVLVSCYSLQLLAEISKRLAWDQRSHATLNSQW